MADISKVKLYFLEPYAGTGYGQYPDPNKIPPEFKVIQIADVNGDVVTASAPHGLYPDNLVSPAPMALFVDRNDPGAPGSRAVKVLDAYRLQLLLPLTGIAAGQYMVLYKWTERTELLKAGTLTVTRQNDHSDSAEFEIITNSGGFLPYAGMNILIKYGDGFTLFGGVVRSAKLSVAGRYRGPDSALVARVYADTYSVLAKRRVIMTKNFWQNTLAGDIARQMLDILKQEGVTEGRIDPGLYLRKYPSEFTGTFTILQILDNLAEQCGYIWYINPDKAFFFVPKEASYNPASQAWEPYITDAPFNIQDGGAFTDYGRLSLSTGIELYNNTIHIEGGLDRNKREAYSLGRDDAQILQTQLRTGGSGVWGKKFENNDINFLIAKTVEDVSPDGVITITAHELTVGDYLFNIDLNYLGSRVSEVLDADRFKIYGSIGVSAGSKVGWYSQANAVIRNNLANYGGALPKTLEFDTFTIGGSKIWAPGQRVILNLEAFGEAGSGNYVTERVEYADVMGSLRIRVVAGLRAAKFFE